MSLQAAIEWIQDQSLTLSGVGEAPDNPRDTASNSKKIWVVAYPSGGEIKSASDGWGYDLHNITIQLLTWRNDLSEAFQRLEGFPHNLARLIQADPTMNNEVSTYGTITYNFVSLNWNDIPAIGYEMVISDVKILTTF